MGKKLLFIINPRSGKAQIRNKLIDILDVFVKGGYDVTVYPTQGVGDASKCVQRMAENADLIVCSGGDGTLDEVVTGLMEANLNIPIGYIPSGSTNDFANSLDIPGDMVKAAKDIIEGDLYSVDVGSFNGDTFIYVAAFGLFTDVSYETSQDLKNILGHLAYVMEGTKRIFDVKSYWVKAEANGETYEGEYIYGMVTNAHSIGGFKNLVGPGVEMNDGLFEVTLIKKPTNILELNEIIASLLSAVDNTPLIESFKTDTVRFYTLEEISWTLDGEFGGKNKEVIIKNRKQALDIVINP